MHHPATQQIHAGYAPEGPHHPVAVPVHQSTAYRFPDHATAVALFRQEAPGFTYSRTGNPTVAAFEARLAALEGGVGAVGTASGQSAVALALLALLPAGTHLVASSQLYGGTVDLLTDTFGDLGIAVTSVDPADPGAWTAAVRPETRAFFLEAVTNPLATLPDLPALADAAHAAGVPVVVDATLATPALYRPLEHGADVVVHSATKFLGGHGAALGGAIVDGGTFDFGADPERWPRLAWPQARFGGRSLVERHGRSAYLALVRARFLHDLGPSLAPASAAHFLQGLETLQLRMARHTASALTVAEHLAAHPAVARVHHPGLPGHPSAGLAARDFPHGTGSVFSFDLAAGPGAVGPFLDALALFQLVANVGDARSLACHPATMTHCRLSPEQRVAAGIAETTIRLSVGLEDPADLIADLDRALAVAAGPVAASAAPVAAAGAVR
ncbi:O-acetylhomoserine aminocarboxypropyltransferase/cysteine synthase [Micrococcus flavus]|uniref:homocysteine desulfhydrase n=1 Tax=Micrococcus flavus TaxID=384602 RepID=A0A4Y8X2R2_9MICC|nr:PLP-dependent transferase [Micrococcus flavus]MBB4883642.1 O-acetylhomoserine (thiol)-lyase [Micrococcus flavus]TFI02424.1 O-acetylhomoserine aminocarboxypropyltransferase/cysteine synthase [Micrococcus flavus]GGK52807.1 O-acetylhomoserine aminocarboxypropyltransferase [Micrococcus flavus]